MSRKILCALALGSAMVMAVPAAAQVLTPGAAAISPGAFDATTQGTVLASITLPGQAATFNSSIREAVYRNTSGTLDFYFQIFQTGAGTAINPDTGALYNDAIQQFTAANFASRFTVSGFSYGTATGIFSATNNPGGSTTTMRLSNAGVITTEFGSNSLVTGENSAIYIFRTNAASFTTGTLGVSDGSTVTVSGFQPIGPAVPEPATWGMMILGFGVVGGVMRRRKTTVAFAA